MYLTIYKTNQTTQHITDYNSIMQNADLQDSVEYYRTTIKIDNPKPYTELSNKQQEHLLKVIEAITEAHTLLEPYFETYSEQYKSSTNHIFELQRQMGHCTGRKQIL